MELPENQLAQFHILYGLTVACELPVLLIGLSSRHGLRARLFAAVWLNACSYPVVFFVLPQFVQDRVLYLTIAEVFAPVSECLLFWLAFIAGRPCDRRATVRDMVTVILANLTSFGVGLILWKSPAQ
jgi:hypothetical protein